VYMQCKLVTLLRVSVVLSRAELPNFYSPSIIRMMGRTCSTNEKRDKYRKLVG
jgi:hypothetical protein